MKLEEFSYRKHYFYTKKERKKNSGEWEIWAAQNAKK